MNGLSGYEDRYEAIDYKGATLNGNRAKVSGAMNRFATVTDLTTGLSAEWSWETVGHIIANKGGAFKS